jgi:class 3 adenylate cyclase/tetratricopeptide (TPR) repeat protein
MRASEGGALVRVRCASCGTLVVLPARFCPACGVPLAAVPAHAEWPDEQTQRRHVTVMFCDLVSSTPIAESLDPEDYREVLRRFQRVCVEAIERYEGFTARYTGDGVMVYFGYPRAHEDDPHRAAHVGLRIISEVQRLTDDLRADYDVALHVRVGVHCGVVVAGEMGAGATPEARAIVGEVPHIAARLESLAEPDTLVVSDDVGELITGYFELEPLGDRQLRGISHPVGVHRVLRPTDAIGRLDAVGQRPLTPLVGRDGELATLDAAWHRARDGRGVVVHVNGEAGIGKSRLVRSMLERLGDEVRRVQVWQCSPYHRSSMLYPVLRCLGGMVGTSRTEPEPEPVQLGLLADIAHAAPVDDDRAVSVLVDFLASAYPQRSAPSALMPREARVELLRVLHAVLVANPEHHPMLLVVEDLHWADSTTLDLLGRVLDEVRELPVMCVLTFRDGAGAAEDLPEPDVGIALGALGTEDVRTLLRTMAPGAIDPAAIDKVADISEGVPLFLEATMQMLSTPPSEAGDLLFQSRLVSIPPTLQGLLAERLDRYPELSDVIDLAAVVGHDFPQELLQDVHACARDLGPALTMLVEQSVLRVADGRYEFSHALLQEAAYERLLKGRRRELHRRVAEHLSRSAGDPATWRPEVIAGHWSRCGEPRQAAEWWREAGVQALARAAFAEAADHFRHGLEAVDAARPDASGDLDRVDLATHLGASLQAGRGYAAPEVTEAYARARGPSARLGDPRRVAAVIRGEWMLHLLRADYDDALQLGDEMLALAAQHGGSDHLCEGHLYRGMVHMSRADFEVAREDLEAAYAGYEQPASVDAIYEAQGDTGVGALAYLAAVLWSLGDDHASRRCTEDSVALAERIGRPIARAQAGGMRSLMHLTRGELAELADCVEQSRSFAAERNIAYWATFTALIEAWLAGRTGDPAAGVTRLRETLETYLGGGSRLGLPMFANLLADLCQHAGDTAGAMDAIEIGEEHIAATGERFSECQLLITKGDLFMTGSQLDPLRARTAYEEAASAARHQHARPLELRALARLTTLERRLGEPCTRVAAMADLVAWFGPESAMPDVVRACALLARKELA